MKIGICTGGGDCPGLNAVIRAVTRHGILNHGMDVFGVERSITGLMSDPPAVRRLTLKDVAGVINLGGTILGTENKGSPFKDPEKGAAAKAKAFKNWKSLGLDCLIVVGGDGTQRMALQLHDAGMPILGIPKTIDNDYAATDIAVGFTTAVDVAADAAEGTLTITAAADALVGDLANVVIRATGDFNGRAASTDVPVAVKIVE